MINATLDEYGNRGWDGLSFDSVARRAGVGKSSLYLRWPTKAALVAAALRSRKTTVTVPNTGSLREDLLGLVTSLYHYCLDPAGWAKFRVSIEAAGAHDRLGAFARDAQEVHADMVVEIVARAVERGEVDAAVSPVRIAEVVIGTVLMQVLAPRLDGTSLDPAEVPGRAAGLIHLVLHGALAGEQVVSDDDDPSPDTT